MLGPRGLQPHRQTFLGVKIIKSKNGRCSGALLSKIGIIRNQKNRSNEMLVVSLR